MQINLIFERSSKVLPTSPQLSSTVRIVYAIYNADGQRIETASGHYSAQHRYVLESEEKAMKKQLEKIIAGKFEIVSVPHPQKPNRSLFEARFTLPVERAYGVGE